MSNNKYLIYFATLLTLIVSISCKTNNSEIDNSEYYVQYTVNSSTIYYNGKLNVTISNTNNSQTSFSIDTKSTWQTTIGPVKKGFKAVISVSEASNNYGHLTMSTQVYASKNNGPFTFVADDHSNTPRSKMSLSCKVDF